MENRAHAIVAICFLVGLSATGALIFYWLTSAPGEPLPYRIITEQSVAGLSPQSRVEFKGLEVGHVTDIHFHHQDRSRVVIDFTVRRNTYITDATYAVLAKHGLTGGEVLELRLGDGPSTPLETSAADPTRIPLKKGLLASLKGSARQDMKTLQSVLESLDAILDTDNRQHLAASIRQIDTATARLATIEQQLLPILQEMPPLLADVQKSLEQSHTLLANANQVTQQAQQSIRDLGELEETIQQLTRNLDRQTRPDVDTLSRNLLQTSRLLDKLLRKLNAKPQSLLFGSPEPPPGPGEPGFQANHEEMKDD